MTRREFEELVLDTYAVKADYPFDEDFETGVFRHTGTGKWFAIAMNVGKTKLGMNEEGNIDVINLKCAPEVIESLVLTERGIYPAYHMNKTHWLTVALGECDMDTVSWLLSISYDLTARKTAKEKHGNH